MTLETIGISAINLIKRTIKTVSAPINTNVDRKLASVSPTNTGKKIEGLHPAHTDK